jgi:hypothetical protein
VLSLEKKENENYCTEIQLSAPSFSLGRILAANNFYQNVFMLVALIATASLSYRLPKGTIPNST